MDADLVREIVRSEIIAALKTLEQAAADLDRPYETQEILSTALGAVANAANRAARELADPDTSCKTCGEIDGDHEDWCPNGS